jgi:hypothetical protein
MDTEEIARSKATDTYFTTDAHNTLGLSSYISKRSAAVTVDYTHNYIPILFAHIPMAKPWKLPVPGNLNSHWL